MQAYAAEAGAERAEEPMEEAGMSEEIIQKAGIVHSGYKLTTDNIAILLCV